MFDHESDLLSIYEDFKKKYGKSDKAMAILLNLLANSIVSLAVVLKDEIIEYRVLKKIERLEKDIARWKSINEKGELNKLILSEEELLCETIRGRQDIVKDPSICNVKGSGVLTIIEEVLKRKSAHISNMNEEKLRDINLYESLSDDFSSITSSDLECEYNLHIERFYKKLKGLGCDTDEIDYANNISFLSERKKFLFALYFKYSLMKIQKILRRMDIDVHNTLIAKEILEFAKNEKHINKHVGMKVLFKILDTNQRRAYLQVVKKAE